MTPTPPGSAAPPQPGILPIHGFVLAGGRSTRMRMDKATLPFRRRPMVQIAVEKLRTFCAEVSIAGNRPDLAAFAEVIPETRLAAGPAAGIEAGLQTARHPWALFIPVDVPLIPATLLRHWATDPYCSYLTCENQPHPAFCLLPTASADPWSRAIESTRKLLVALQAVGATPHALGHPHDFLNINTPADLVHAEAHTFASQ